MEILLVFIVGAVVFAINYFFDSNKPSISRRDYYRDVYLNSDEWKRKRYVVLRRDKWRCVYCDSPATQVHHKRYAKYNIGKEPIDWLVSVCKTCHEKQHGLLKPPAHKIDSYSKKNIFSRKWDSMNL